MTLPDGSDRPDAWGLSIFAQWLLTAEYGHPWKKPHLGMNERAQRLLVLAAEMELADAGYAKRQAGAFELTAAGLSAAEDLLFHSEVA